MDMPRFTVIRLAWLNPLTLVFISAVILYSAFCIYWDSVSLREAGFADYLAILCYPVSYPIHSVTLYYQRLADPYTGHVWGWEFFACILFAIALLTSLFASIVSANCTIRKISIRAGIPLTLLWVTGAILWLVASAIS
jgi:hypothetical protein